VVAEGVGAGVAEGRESAHLLCWWLLWLGLVVMGMGDWRELGVMKDGSMDLRRHGLRSACLLARMLLLFCF